MTLSSTTREWLHWMRLTSHPLRRLGGEGNPNGFGSATLLDHQGRRFALTAHHVIPVGADGWFLDLRFCAVKGTETYTPGHWHTVAEFRRASSSVVHVDFSFAEIAVDLNTSYQERSPWVSGEAQDRHIFHTSDVADPNREDIYAFAGETRPEQHAPGSIAMQMNVFPGLQFVGTTDELHTFKLPVAHPGHAEFRGCSGAPILDTNRRVVALLVGGDEDTNTVQGVSMSRLLPALDLYCGATGDA